MSESRYLLNKMEYYYDRGERLSNYIEIADKCTNGILVLWDKCALDSNAIEGNVFLHKFEGEDIRLKKEYLYTMDYLSCVLSAYRETGKEIYKTTFENYMEQFCEFIVSAGPVFDELPVMGQILLVIKAIDVLGHLPHQNELIELLIRYTSWLMDDTNYFFDNNHGLFFDLTLLHASILLNMHPDAPSWQKHALDRTRKLFSVAYYNDCTNNEHSLAYFHHNNILYNIVIDFCKNYHIAGLSDMEYKLDRAKEALNTFAHKDGSFPVIGDGSVFYSDESNACSRLFPDIGIAVVKIKDLYLSFKCKMVFQSHAHTDISGITARYKDIDFVIDSGHYNYDRYTPINRFVRSSAGHSGIFPLFADDIFQKEFCQEVNSSDITEYSHNGGSACVKGQYQFRDVRVCRELLIYENEIIIKDSWKCDNPTTMRQRFVIPKELIEHCIFTVSQRLVETRVGNTCFKYQIIPSSEDAITEVQFGVAAPKYYEYETTMLLDTYVDSSISGEITARISFWEEK